MDQPALRDALEARALAGADWLELIVALAEAGRCPVRLAAADAALLCAAGPDGASSLPGAEEFDAPRPPILDAADVARAFAAGSPVAVRTLDGLAMRGLAVRSGGRRVGVLLVGSAGAGAEALLRAGSTAVAIVAVRRDAQASAVAETAGWFVDELRFGSRRSADEVAAMAQRFGVNLAEPQTAAVIGYDGPDLRTFSTALSWVEAPIRVDGGRAWTVLGADARERAALIQRRLQAFLGSGQVLVAAGPPALGVEAIRGGFEKAGFALRLLAAGRVPSVRAAGTVSFDELGLAGLLFAVPRGELAEYVAARLQPLLAHPELVATLRAWYASGGSRLSVAAAVHIHRNSVGHRMDRLRTLLGVDPTDPAVAVQLQTALVAMDVLAALE
ncbi:helix-turn-helix domain-containing protein [Jatrophihabitans cynanchi]|uniref:Helix-turn-helix domain-containing protein n=1 Tax=Jatrophihabitans cynanchi TaxID=2944128 RepID=A0ABY7K2Q9_9ACTN|nr:helix-turn-helix domain-containing protein [Jatrophihabitans sp. SB3-54]WAX59112.1 helix-turn-helix domain-containing protein [Jatrophihabitans sp. SB3-54]